MFHSQKTMLQKSALNLSKDGQSNRQKISPYKNKGLFRYLAEAVRFELTEGVNPRRFSRPVH